MRWGLFLFVCCIFMTGVLGVSHINQKNQEREASEKYFADFKANCLKKNLSCNYGW